MICCIDEIKCVQRASETIHLYSVCYLIVLCSLHFSFCTHMTISSFSRSRMRLAYATKSRCLIREVASPASGNISV